MDVSAISFAAPRRRKDLSERNRSVVEMYRAGGTLIQVADRHGISIERVRQILVAAKEPFRPRSLLGQAMRALDDGAPIIKSPTRQKFELLDKLSRERELTLAESMALENAMKKLGML